MNPKKLLIIGLIFIAIHTLLYSFIGLSMSYWPQEAIEKTNHSWFPAVEDIQGEFDAFTGTYMQQLAKRSSIALFLETSIFLMIFLWRAGGLMLVGMALFKWGILSAERSNKFYRNSFIISWLIGLPVVIYGIVANYQHQWSLEYSMFLGSQFNYWGSLLVSFGFISLIMLMVKADGFRWLKDRLAAVGQMALTNYLMQSIICVFIFYGIGFGLIGQVERIWQIIIVFTIWILQILWSRPWLNHYLFGPVEWLWRSLTYFRVQPLKK
jgi:uncharacterized protein